MYLFYFWLYLVFVAVCRLSLVALSHWLEHSVKCWIKIVRVPYTQSQWENFQLSTIKYNVSCTFFIHALFQVADISSYFPFHFVDGFLWCAEAFRNIFLNAVEMMLVSSLEITFPFRDIMKSLIGRIEGLCHLISL